MNLIMLIWVGKHVYFTYICLYFIVHSSPYLCVCGHDQISCYPGADDAIGVCGHRVGSLYRREVKEGGREKVEEL